MATLSVSGFLAWLLSIYPYEKGPSRHAVVRMELARGSSAASLARELYAHGLLKHPAWLWALYARFRGADRHLRSGTIDLSDDLTPREILARVAVGYEVQVRITIPEGFNRFDIAHRLESLGVCPEQDFLERTRSYEGHLFPDTYYLLPSADCRDAVERITNNWQNKAGRLFEGHAKETKALHDAFGWSSEQILTLASIVEKEAAVADEQPIIAGVFFNRLRFPSFSPKLLQTDPTVLYGCLAASEQIESCKNFDGTSITRAMLDDSQNPYNTYRMEGLPPGPICNPGLQAIRAVLSPATHKYLYFVAKGSGRHYFSATHPEHMRAVKKYMRSR